MPGEKEEYLSYAQLIERIPYSRSKIRYLIQEGILIEGYHFTRPGGIKRPDGSKSGRPIFIWSKIREWVDTNGKKPDKAAIQRSSA